MGSRRVPSDLLYPRTYSTRMLLSSNLGLAAACVATACGQYVCAIVSLVVTCVSVNHWRDPRTHSLRRKVDILVANGSLLHHGSLAYASSSESISYVWALW